MIEAAENVLRDLGFYDVRVRHHELRNGSLPAGSAQAPILLHLARIRWERARCRNFWPTAWRSRCAAALKQVGYTHVTLDLMGYRRGSANEAL